jgi:hypothetical protein
MTGKKSKGKGNGKSRSFAWLGMTSKDKGNSRFPSGMTGKKSKGKDKGNSRFPSGMTG